MQERGGLYARLCIVPYGCGGGGAERLKAKYSTRSVKKRLKDYPMEIKGFIYNNVYTPIF
jgi:hypothetical protein